MNIFFLFLDGVGLGQDDPLSNPFIPAKTPFLDLLLDGRSLVNNLMPFTGENATLLSLDACLGVSGAPQSATGQATLLTGVNIPERIGYHYGPKPNPEVSAYLKNGNIFSKLLNIGKRCAFLNAYPPAYFKHIQSGRRLYAAIPLAAVSAGLTLLTAQDLYDGNAVSADFTGQGWRAHLGFEDTPLYTPGEAGVRLGQLAQKNDFSLFEYWLSDYAGHQQDMKTAIGLIETLDQVIEGLCNSWNPSSGLIVITSDHGNLEDLSTRKHTHNPVPAILIGSAYLRKKFQENLTDIAGITPAFYKLLSSEQNPESSEEMPR